MCRDQQLGRSVLVTTYQAGKFALRLGDAGAVDNPSRTVPTRIGLAVNGNDRAIGAALWIRQNDIQLF
jgi:hypothetical protein